jgi:hypothetical protein
LGVYRAEDLLPAVREALAHSPHTPQARDAFVARYAHAVDGQAAARIAEFVGDVARARTP